MAARMLVAELNGDPPRESLRLDTYLCRRRTLGPAPGR
jgi:hypothetical protein